MDNINLLLDPLPTEVKIGGILFPTNSDFRAGIRYEIAVQNAQSDEETVLGGLQAFYGDNIPKDVKGAIEAMMWFYSGGGKEDRKVPGGGRYSNGKDAYSFATDDGYIYAAFMDQYRIDLTKVRYMHWWKFQALFKALKDDNRISGIMGYRVANLNDLPKEQKKLYSYLQKLYEIPLPEEQRNELNELAEILIAGGNPDEVLNRG